MFKLVITSLILVFTSWGIDQKSDPQLAATWQIESIASTTVNVEYYLPVYLKFDAYGRYGFTNFTVNSCGGVFKTHHGEEITIKPADCTEACCDTDDERSLMTLMPRMKSYAMNSNTLILSGDVEGNIVFNAYNETPDTINGAVNITLKKVESK